jgi:hypothetical protein
LNAWAFVARRDVCRGASSSSETHVPESFALTSEQLETFDRRGVLRLPGFYPRAAIAPMADRLWADLETRYGLRRERPETWQVELPAGFQALKRSGAFAALGSPKLFALADLLLGAGAWEAPTLWGGPLVTFPTEVPSLLRPPWHLDITGAERLDPLPTLRVFTFLEAVRPHGGGTLYVAGSHRLAVDMERAAGGPVRSAQVRDRLRAEHPWFADLLATATADLHARIDGAGQAGPHTVRLEEMTGDPGDLVVMHPAILHGASHNAHERPRLMLTEWIPRREKARE